MDGILPAAILVVLAALALGYFLGQRDKLSLARMFEALKAAQVAQADRVIKAQADREKRRDQLRALRGSEAGRDSEPS